ncbi:hypothetical protein KTQ42_21075 [Noviherbaspirillum sp. L7-7A]|uniref:hypothetical protein n=1 Tax=Noviherbaspirillum sp. L7-7A TaxID=2850560 RepID=UPI001C2C352A|nr:hypothetical protein [Noviherbaspirillum sp. L7-7A]MBV0881774.1 hypothetical protein [Noviherbaspirillum sp. L7-7A]
MSFAASAGRRRWILESIAVYVDDHAVALQVAEAVKRDADQAARMGVFQLENGDRVAWVRFEDRKDGPLNHHDGGAS